MVRTPEGLRTKSIGRSAGLAGALALSLVVPGAASVAGSHTWDVWEVFSNADGTVQFIELRETNGTPGETGLGGHAVISKPSSTSFTITHSVASRWPRAC